MTFREREWHVGLWHLPAEFFLWKSLTLPREEVHANGACDRRGTSAPRWPPCMQEPPTKCLLPSPFPSTGSQSPFGVAAPCKNLFVIQDLSPPYILQTKTTYSGHKNQVKAHLQHDDLITEGLQMLQKPLFKPRQNSGVVIIKYPWLACSGWKMVSAVVIILPHLSLFSCMKWSWLQTKWRSWGTAEIPRHFQPYQTFLWTWNEWRNSTASNLDRTFLKNNVKRISPWHLVAAQNRDSMAGENKLCYNQED